MAWFLANESILNAPFKTATPVRSAGKRYCPSEAEPHRTCSPVPRRSLARHGALLVLRFEDERREGTVSADTVAKTCRSVRLRNGVDVKTNAGCGVSRI